VSLYIREVIFVWLTRLAADEDYRGFHGPDFEGDFGMGISEARPYHGVSEMLRG
jgi:hypothetical protein